MSNSSNNDKDKNLILNSMADENNTDLNDKIVDSEEVVTDSEEVVSNSSTDEESSNASLTDVIINDEETKDSDDLKETEDPNNQDNNDSVDSNYDVNEQYSIKPNRGKKIIVITLASLLVLLGAIYLASDYISRYPYINGVSQSEIENSSIATDSVATESEANKEYTSDDYKRILINALLENQKMKSYIVGKSIAKDELKSNSGDGDLLKDCTGVQWFIARPQDNYILGYSNIKGKTPESNFTEYYDVNEVYGKYRIRQDDGKFIWKYVSSVYGFPSDNDKTTYDIGEATDNGSSYSTTDLLLGELVNVVPDVTLSNLNNYKSGEATIVGKSSKNENMTYYITLESKNNSDGFQIKDVSFNSNDWNGTFKLYYENCKSYEKQYNNIISEIDKESDIKNYVEKHMGIYDSLELLKSYNGKKIRDIAKDTNFILDLNKYTNKTYKVGDTEHLEIVLRIHNGIESQMQRDLEVVNTGSEKDSTDIDGMTIVGIQ